MIDFSCPGCGERFAVPDNAAGRNVRCKKCGRQIVVPITAPDSTITRTTPMRHRRLTADAEQITRAFTDCAAIRIVSTEGTPPEKYIIEYQIKGLEHAGKAPISRETHRIEVQLTSDYPRLAPKCRMLTPIFHPNIDAATICIGDHWTAAERLVDLVIRIGEMIAYQAYNIKSPLNAEAAMWADLHANELPIDSRELRPPELQAICNLLV
jgi:predicted Zn finger-like uncharacterized protein